MSAYDYMPGIPAAGHITGGGFWHPGGKGNCVKCEPGPALRVPGVTDRKDMHTMIQLDDMTRTVETGTLVEFAHTAFPHWNATGDESAVAVWLGNCSERDREAIRAAARRNAVTGQVLRIGFPSVMTFILAYSGGVYRCYVPEDAALPS